jgi:hypothetical protein
MDGILRCCVRNSLLFVRCSSHRTVTKLTSQGFPPGDTSSVSLRLPPSPRGKALGVCRTRIKSLPHASGARKRGMPVASPAGDRYSKSLPRDRGRGTALAVDEVLERNFYSECTLKIKTIRKNGPENTRSQKQRFNSEKLCTNFATFLFACTSHRTVTKLNLARLSAR